MAYHLIRSSGRKENEEEEGARDQNSWFRLDTIQMAFNGRAAQKHCLHEAAVIGSQETAADEKHLELLPVSLVIYTLEFVTVSSRVQLAGCNKFWRCLVYKECFVLWEDIEIYEEEYLTDSMLSSLLENVDAKNVTESIDIQECPLVRGEGLKPLRDSRVLQQLFIYTERDPLDQEDIAIQILTSCLPYNLRDVYLPPQRGEYDQFFIHISFSDSVRLFLTKLRAAQVQRALDQEIRCAGCQEFVVDASRQLVPNYAGVRGIQCFEECNRYLCQRSSCPVKVLCCAVCSYVCCEECDCVEQCGICNHCYCPDCVYISSCDNCDAKCCDHCPAFFGCDLCDKALCVDCAVDRDFHTSYCDLCEKDFCSDCQYHMTCPDCGFDRCNSCITKCNGCDRQCCTKCFNDKHGNHVRRRQIMKGTFAVLVLLILLSILYLFLGDSSGLPPVRAATSTVVHRAAFLPNLPAHQPVAFRRSVFRPIQAHSPSYVPSYVEEKTVVILYHKPPGVITSHSSADAVPSNSETARRNTVYDEVMRMHGFVGTKSPSFQALTGIQSKLHAIGRLDADTSGLLLLTNDGGLVHHVTNPTASKSPILKTYEAVIMGNWNNSALEFLQSKGIDIGSKYGGMSRAYRVMVLDHPRPKLTRVEITVGEGKNRQVRRMFHAIGSGVMKLKRTRIGNNLTLGDLEEGQWRLLTDDEVAKHLDWNVRLLSRRVGNGGRKEKRRSTTNRRRRRQKSRATRRE